MAEDALATFKRQVSPLVGIDLGAYKDRQMERRINALMSRANVSDHSAYLDLLKRDARRLQEFIDGLTINVSEWFRNPEQFQALEREVLPDLLDRFGTIKIWSAGSSVGCEIYSVLILLDRMNMLGRAELLGTDIDDRALEQAREGWYGPSEQKGLSPDIIKRYFEGQPGGILRFNPELASLVKFEKHNLLSDPAPAGCHLAICRNVVIYFTEESKAVIHRSLRGSLQRGGILFVGSTERIFRYRDLGLEQVRTFFYRKVVA